MAICRDCHAIEHQGHNCKFLSEMSKSAKEIIHETIQDIQVAMHVRQSILDEIESYDPLLTDSTTGVITQIRHYKKYFIEMVTNHFEDLEEKTLNVTHASRKTLETFADKLNQDMISLQNALHVGEAACTFARDTEIIDTSNILLYTIQLHNEMTCDIEELKISLRCMVFNIGNTEVITDSNANILGMVEELELFNTFEAVQASIQDKNDTFSLNEHELLKSFSTNQHKKPLSFMELVI